ncbi:FHA domain-containing protein [Natronospira bacteriovora]|uniref:FHA domain-containing protein n=1 Tax=Natronospira bacteriovora TaxID=3069753 RepID=A0ABU0W4A3_9GAMM|nr:FHA domain-containing protein [Natronospira sp. AB-CW4]MDQ2068847.1 FHA domain-containing protein [Natronospira sp. AB-CW4]
MARLSVHHRDALVGQFELGKRLTLGRQEDNDIHLDDGRVSGHHAIVELRGDHYCVEDLGSTNGTHLGDRRVRRVGLRDGDAFHIGPFRIQYQGPSAPPSFQDTMILRLDDLANTGADSSALKEAARTDTAVNGKKNDIRIEVLSGDNAGETLILDEAVTTIGVAGEQVAAVTRRRDGFYLVPVAGGSPRVNGRETGPRSMRLKNGDEMEVAGVRLAFRE